MTSKQCRVGQFFREQRVNKGMTQSQVSEHTGTSYQQVQKYENGTCTMNIVMFKKFCDVFGLNAGDTLNKVMEVE
jgi:transcriptional regulator with XRE-family HTH domain